MVKEPPIGIRLDTHVRAALEKAAKAEERSLSFLIQKAIEEWLKARKYLK